MLLGKALLYVSYHSEHLQVKDFPESEISKLRKCDSSEPVVGH